MTLVTTCPVCVTQFFVTQTQLTANKGKVRCGQCQHVFNANSKLHELAVEEIITDNPTPEQTIEVAQIEDNQPVAEEANEQATEIEPIVAIEEPSQIVPDVDADVATTEFKTEEAVTEDVSPISAQPLATPQLVDFMIRPEQVETEPLQFEDYFAGSSKLKNKPVKIIYRWLIALLVLLLLPLAILQSAYYFRTQIASQLPTTEPYLTQACELIGCKVELPKQLDALVIDDSEMREDANHAHVLQFSITLLNKADIALLYPSIELTLTDANDETLIRRTFTPSEYLASTNHNVESGFAAKDRLPVRLALNTNDLTVAGYRLELVE